MILFLVAHLNPSRFQSYTACCVGRGELLKRSQPFCAATKHFELRWAFDPRGIMRVARFVRDQRIDLVQTYGLRADTVGRIGARLGGARVVISSIRSIDPWRKWHHTWTDRLTSPWVNHFVANSEAGRDATVAREKFAARRISVVYSGIPTREIPWSRRPEIREQLEIPPKANPVVGVLANLREMKGHRDIIEAIPFIRERFPSIVFLFAGRDDSNGEIEKLAREKGVADHIRFLGYVSDTTPLLAVMDIFLLPSHWEGLPAAVLEAMHAGLPIITTRVGGIPELVRDDQEALLIEPGNVQALACSISQMARDGALRIRLGQNAMKRASEEFSVRQMTHRMEDLYQDMLLARTEQPRSG